MPDETVIKGILRTPSIGRREFISSLAAGGLTIAAANTLWATRASASPKHGGNLVAGIGGASASDDLDPRKWSDTFPMSVSRAFRDGLVELVPGNRLAPALAESWEPSADAKTWRFSLRKGVAFSNGKPFTSADAIASLNMHRGKDTQSNVKGLFLAVSDVRAEGDHTLVVELDGPNAQFPYLLTDPRVPMVLSVDGEVDTVSPVGTGAYLLEEFEPGVRAILIRNRSSWHGESQGFVDSATLVAINDATARQSALMAGEVDVINKPDPKTAKRLEGMRGIRVETIPSNIHMTMPMMVDSTPFGDVNIRNALKYAIDRNEFVEKVLNGYGVVGNDHPIGPGFKYHDASLEQRPYDPDKAKFYLDKAGVSSLNVDYHAADAAFEGAMDGAVLFQESAAKAGINVNVVRVPNDGYWSNVWNVKPFVASFWGSRPIEDMILSVCYHSESHVNETHWKNDQLDQLIVSARGELDEAKRAQMYSDAQHIIHNDGATIVPAFGMDVMALKDSVGTPEGFGGGWEMDGAHFVKRWWKA